jgi:acetolactate synthase regulatory subunit
MELTIQFQSAGRSPEVLARQIEKLFDVRHVSLVKESGVALKESFAC